MSTRQFDNVIAGWRVFTTYPYGKLLNFTKVADIIAQALQNGSPDEDGLIVYRYTAQTKGQTNPYRTVKFRTAFLPGLWVEVRDYPAGGHIGLELFEFENWHLFPEQPKIHSGKDGLRFEIVKPKGWR
jgi:hypothetical protein